LVENIAGDVRHYTRKPGWNTDRTDATDLHEYVPSVSSVRSVFYPVLTGEDLMKEEHLTRQIIGAFYRVHNALGYGFLEKVYEKALTLELRRLGLVVTCQQPVKVYYEGELVGDYIADIVVNGGVIIELKAAEALHPAHEAQLVNYLRATEIEVGLLLNFGDEPQFSRKLFTNDRKKLGRRV
jgi:GxxExxY protein